MFDGLRYWLFKKYVRGDAPDKLLAVLILRIMPYVFIISLLMFLLIAVIFGSAFIRVVGRWFH